MARADAWYVAAFGARYLDVYPHRDLESARGEAAWLVSRGVRGRVLDLCCGFGRHTLALRELGVDAYGVDRSEELLQRARDLPGAELLVSRLVLADARRLPLREASFDSAVVLFSSFGYFGDEGDRVTLEGLARVLRPEGLLVLDLMNPDRVRAGLVPRSRSSRGALEILERRALVDRGRRVVKEVELREENRPVSSWREEVRLYEPEEVAGLLGVAGFEIAGRHGAFDDTPPGAGAPRQIVIGRRKV